MDDHQGEISEKKAPSLSDLQRTLIRLQNTTAQLRGQLLKELRQEGYQVEFSNGIYTLIDQKQQEHSLPFQKCLACQEMKILSDYMGRMYLQLWCKSCREADPKGAKQAQDRWYQQQYPLEKRRAKWARQKERHPGWRERSETHLQNEAAELASRILQEAVGALPEMLEEEYEPYQQRKIQQYFQGIIEQIQQYPSQKKREEQLATELREQAQALLRRAEALSEEK